VTSKSSVTHLHRLTAELDQLVAHAPSGVATAATALGRIAGHLLANRQHQRTPVDTPPPRRWRKLRIARNLFIWSAAAVPVLTVLFWQSHAARR
jgi:hypothetical protein